MYVLLAALQSMSATANRSNQPPTLSCCMRLLLISAMVTPSQGRRTRPYLQPRQQGGECTRRGAWWPDRWPGRLVA
jgi:hypothetical protein